MRCEPLEGRAQDCMCTNELWCAPSCAALVPAAPVLTSAGAGAAPQTRCM
jgi:hypothetical protein